MTAYFTSYAVVGLVLLLGAVLVGLALGAARVLRPRTSGGATDQPYECGVEPVDPDGRAWAQLHVRHYVYAYLYLVFAVDAVFLFPWATVFAAPGFGGATVAEMFVFVGFLAAGLAYAARKGVLRWT